ncbi:MAG: V-type ATP synthase subunit D [candidate division KSB1 bacterium]|nr:V-type ATP synthase subunit D [candidate division KSB1 bacterium]
MAKIKLTKNELKAQKDALKRFMRYLPTLELKKKQLLMEIQRVQKEVDELQAEIDRMTRQIEQWVDLYGDESINLHDYVQVREILTGEGNIAGIDIPLFQDVLFDEVPYDFLETPLWIDYGIEAVKEQIRRLAEQQILLKQKALIEQELRTTIQRIKLFEEIKIPEARENIRVIQIALGDQMTAEVVRGKIAKKKIERKKDLQAQV